MTNLNNLDDSLISESAKIHNLEYVEENCKILDSVQILDKAAIFYNSTIKDNVVVKDTVLVHGSIISGNVVLSGDVHVINCNLSGNVKISGKIYIKNINLSGNIKLHSDARLILLSKKELKRVIKVQDKRNNKCLEQIMAEELSIHECVEI